MRDIDIPFFHHLEQLQLELPKNIRQRQIQFGVSEVHPDAGACAPAERDEVFVQPLLL